uniref:Reverse transcriptase zinc-binding domain-containing protein n=1 Tax=Davidia involucrata TaxID=16924 RepID=A0A5B7C5Q8_DAVIN
MSRPVGSWDIELQWAINHLKGDSFKASLLKLTLSAVVYLLWEERNSRIFKGKRRDEGMLIKAIQSAIYYATYSWRGVANTYSNWELSLSFGLTDCIFKKPVLAAASVSATNQATLVAGAAITDAFAINQANPTVAAVNLGVLV